MRRSVVIKEGNDGSLEIDVRSFTIHIYIVQTTTVYMYMLMYAFTVELLYDENHACIDTSEEVKLYKIKCPL